MTGTNVRGPEVVWGLRVSGFGFRVWGVGFGV